MYLSIRNNKIDIDSVCLRDINQYLFYFLHKDEEGISETDENYEKILRRIRKKRKQILDSVDLHMSVGNIAKDKVRNHSKLIQICKTCCWCEIRLSKRVFYNCRNHLSSCYECCVKKWLTFHHLDNTKLGFDVCSAILVIEI